MRGVSQIRCIGAGNDTINGGDGNDSLNGWGGDDVLAGGDGDDTYLFQPSLGGLGSDSIDENVNAGTDTLDFSSLTSNIGIGLGAATTEPVVPGFLSLTLSSDSSIENVIGGSGNNVIGGNTLDNVLTGGAGNDIILAGDGDDTIDGGDGDDILDGGNGNDLLTGGAGNDIINGEDGNDTLIGGAGDDTLSGGNGDDTYLFLPGPTSLGTDSINEGVSGGTDTLDFEYLTSNLTAVLSTTTTQTVVPSFLNLTLSSDSSIENVIGGAGNDVIIGNTLANVLDGRGGDDVILGNDGNDVLYGGDGNDILDGNAGNDVLEGDAGNDTLIGETGTIVTCSPGRREWRRSAPTRLRKMPLKEATRSTSPTSSPRLTQPRARRSRARKRWDKIATVPRSCR